MKKICGKYGLIYSVVSNYIGTIPDKNLKEIEDFKISDDDIPMNVFEQKFSDHSTHRSLMSVKDVKLKWPNINLNYGRFNNNNIYYTTSKIPLHIAAPVKDFTKTNKEILDYKLIDSPVKDPIVLQPVLYKEKRYFLIMTAWGEEAGDENVVNQNFN